MICREIIAGLEQLAPRKLAESWDNIGLLVGKEEQDVHRIMVALDATEEVIDQCVAEEVDLLITHHPIIFKGVKQLTNQQATGRKLMKLMQNNIACYALHTNFDVAVMAKEAAKKLDLSNPRILSQTYQQNLFKLVVYVPVDSIDKVRAALTKEGAGHIGNYSDCTFGAQGMGTFKGEEGTDPYIGTPNEVTFTQEVRLETVVTEDKLERTIQSMLRVHPYEEVAYDIYCLENGYNKLGIGYYGYLQQDMSLEEVAEYVKTTFGLTHVTVIGELDRRVASVAISPGSGEDYIEDALRAKVDVYITGDVKYHAALDAKEKGLMIIDAGHYGTEHLFAEFMRRYLHDYLYTADQNYVGVPEDVQILIANETNPFSII